MMVGDIEVKIDKGVLILSINRANKKNALCEDMYSGFANAFEQLDRDETIRCMLIKANGDTFCGGNDISFFLNGYNMAPNAPVGRFLYGLAGLTKPLVAAVQGAGVGIGLTLLLHCDLAFAAEDIRLSAPFGSLGLVPEAGSSQLLPALIGHRRAMEIFLLGRVIKAKEALAYGLVNEIVPIAQLHEIALDAARKLAELPAEAVYETRRLTRRPPEALSKRIEEECKAFMQRIASEEVQTIFKRFLTRKSGVAPIG
jgi:enoyl-CoA hydratase/carnithine racemase